MNTEVKATKQNINKEPAVYRAVRAVGVLRPKFQPKANSIFADQLDVRGTAFWIKRKNFLITCAHVVQDLVSASVEVTGLLVIGNNGNYTQATIDLIDFRHDLAILRLPKETPTEVLEHESESGLEVTNLYPEIGDNVAYSGFPAGLTLLDHTHAPTYAEGVISAPVRIHTGIRKEI